MWRFRVFDDVAKRVANCHIVWTVHEVNCLAVGVVQFTEKYSVANCHIVWTVQQLATRL